MSIPGHRPCGERGDDLWGARERERRTGKLSISRTHSSSAQSVIGTRQKGARLIWCRDANALGKLTFDKEHGHFTRREKIQNLVSSR